MRKLAAILFAIVLAVASAFIGYRVGHEEGVHSERELKAEREFHLAESRDSAVLSLYILGHLETNNLAGVSTECINNVAAFYRAFGPSTRPEWKDDIKYGDFLRRIEASAERLPELQIKLHEIKQ